jgi:saccharopine dehydrogenase (NAD+, L-glutamate forming)
MTSQPAEHSEQSGDRRPYDIALLGATGFAGRLTAEYLAAAAPPECRWALAGRNAEKLAALRDDLAARNPALGTVDVVTADVTDSASLERLARSTRVLASTVGPYVFYGDAVVAACAAAGTDYLDITGEPEFIDTSYVRHHRTAVQTGARLISAAGFDSLPHDAGVRFTVDQLPADEPLRVSGYVRAHASFSGGTFHSAVTAMSRLRQNTSAARDRRALEEPNSGRTVRAVAGRPHRDPVDGRWALPLPTVDPQIVVRSARAIDRYGPDFRYSHYVVVGSPLTAAATVAGVGAVIGLAQVPPARRLLLDRMQAGDGPSPERRAKSWFTVTFVGGTGDGSRRVVTRVSGGDPGYDETAKMLGESALCLAFDDLPATAGQLTTMAAMGPRLIERLQTAGIRFEVLER